MFASSSTAPSIIEFNTTTSHDDLKMSQKEIARNGKPLKIA